MPVPACAWGGGGLGRWGGGTESVSNWHFLVVVSQPMNWLWHFKEAGQVSRLLHFPACNTSLSGEILAGKMQLPSFSRFTVVILKQKADENEALGHH